MHRSFFGAALLAMALLIAACAPASQAPGASDGAGESEGAGPSEASEPSLAPVETPGNGSGGELDAVLPDEVDGLALEYEFADGASALGDEGIPPEAQAFFDRTGASVDDLSTGFGFAFDQADPENPRILTIFAMRVEGVGEGTLRDEFRSLLEDEGNTFTEANVGGKNVLAFTSEGVEDESYLYVKSDMVFMVGGAPVELVEQALSQLP